MCGRVYGQEEGQGAVMAIASEKGNILRFWTKQTPAEFAEVLQHTRRFTVSRNEITPAGSTAKPIGAVEFPRTSTAFKTSLSAEKYAGFRKRLRLPDDQALDAYLGEKFDFDSLSLYTESNAEFLLAFGLGYLDTDVEKGRFYQYTVYREDTNNTQELWGTAVIFAKEGNFELEKVKIKPERIIAADSNMAFIWQVELPDFEMDTLLPVTESTSRLNTLFNRNSLMRSYGEKIRPYVNRYPLTVINAPFSVFYRINDSDNWTFAGEFLAHSDSTGTHRVVVDVSCVPHDLVEAVLIPGDFAGNRGTSSETYRGVAVTSSTVRLIYSVSARDSVNSIVLRWDALPDEPYYTGIEVAKGSSDSTIRVVTILPPDATGYTDLRVFPAGTIFTYHVRPLFIPHQDLRQEVPAMVMHSCTTFSRPDIPYNLKVSDVEGFARLTWEASEDPAFYSYHVLRGTSPDQLGIISGNVFEKQFIDSADYLSTKITYYYAVMAMTLAQDTSEYSDYVSYVPVTGETFDSPPPPAHELINHELLLRWDDVKLNDDFIAGYLLQRKAEDEPDFRTLHHALLSSNTFLDTTFQIGKSWLYRVASVSIRGDTARYSPAVSIGGALPEAEVPPVENIGVINLSKSIRISWPAVLSGTTDHYTIYRKLPEEASFTPIGRQSAGNFEFEDRNVTTGQIYVYSVTAVNLKGQESRITREKAIYREE